LAVAPAWLAGPVGVHLAALLMEDRLLNGPDWKPITPKGGFFAADRAALAIWNNPLQLCKERLNRLRTDPVVHLGSLSAFQVEQKIKAPKAAISSTKRTTR